jgi:hypothetical protein
MADGKSKTQAVDAVTTFADEAKAQYQAYLNSNDVVYVEPDVVVGPTTS